MHKYVMLGTVEQTIFEASARSHTKAHTPADNSAEEEDAVETMNHSSYTSMAAPGSPLPRTNTGGPRTPLKKDTVTSPARNLSGNGNGSIHTPKRSSGGGGGSRGNKSDQYSVSATDIRKMLLN